jgi:hypothetical protein
MFVMYYEYLRLYVLAVASVKITIFWDVSKCSLLESSRQGDSPDNGGISTSETLANLYET